MSSIAVACVANSVADFNYEFYFFELIGWSIANQAPYPIGTKELFRTLTLFRGFVYGGQDDLSRVLPGNRTRVSGTGCKHSAHVSD